MKKWVYMAVCFIVLFLLAGCLPPSPAVPSESPAIPSPTLQPTPFRQRLDYSATVVMCGLPPAFNEKPALLLNKEDLDLFHELHLSWVPMHLMRSTHPLVAHQLAKFTKEFFADHGLIVVSGMMTPGCFVDVDSIWVDGDVIELSINTIDATAAHDPDAQYRTWEYIYHMFIEISNENRSPNDIIKVMPRTTKHFREWELRTASSGPFPIDYNLRTVLNHSGQENSEPIVVSSWESLQEYIDNELSLFYYMNPISGEEYYYPRYSSVDPAGLTTAMYTDEFFVRHRLVLFSYTIDYDERVIVDRVESDERSIELYTKKLPLEGIGGEHYARDSINYFFILEMRAEDVEGKVIRVHQQ